MLKLILCDYIDAYILISIKIKKITITAVGDDAAARQAGEGNNEVIFNNYVPFAECISEINNTQVDNTKNLSDVMSMYNFIKYSDNCLQSSGSLWQYYRD